MSKLIDINKAAGKSAAFHFISKTDKDITRIAVSLQHHLKNICMKTIYE
jgi:hypothetical protein